MTTQSQIPLKWYVPFAQGDASRVELPVTTADPTRASQTLGFPPLTMQPPESGGVPPQGEDFNGGMNQVARVAWWTLLGGGWTYDAAFATNANISGYPNGAKLQSADLKGDWLSIADNNQNNPDTGSGSAWVPGFQYGTTALTGLTGGTVTPTPAQASKNSITLSGTLGSALTIVLPTWTKNWSITNNTTGAFVTIVKTAAGSGVTIPQNGAPTRVSGDGTNITQVGENIAAGTSATQAAQLGQVAGIVGSVRNLNGNLTAANASIALTADEIVVETALGGARYCLANFSATINTGTTGLNGMATGQTMPASGFVAVYAIYNPTSGVAGLLGANANAAVPEICAATLPSGFTASALLTVLPTTAGSLIAVSLVRDRWVGTTSTQIFSTNATAASPTIVNNVVVPLNAKSCGGFLQISNTAAASVAMSISATTAGLGGRTVAYTLSAAGSTAAPFDNVAITTGQRLFYTGTSSAGTPTFQAQVSSYTI